MGGACGMYGGEEMHRVLMDNLRERDHVEELSIDERIILKIDLKEVGWEGVD